VSWELLGVPLHEVATNGAWDWAVSAGTSFGMPDDQPPTQALPQAAHVVQEFRAAGCHGTAWFHITGLDSLNQLPECPRPETCASSGGLDLGEVRLDPGNGDCDHLEPTTPIEVVTFRKPVSLAVLTAMHRLASSAGPMLIFDDGADTRVRGLAHRGP
jgi:hypothetical protein